MALESKTMETMLVSDNSKGFILAVLSSAFTGASFILKKLGLKRAGDSGTARMFTCFTYGQEGHWTNKCDIKSTICVRETCHGIRVLRTASPEANFGRFFLKCTRCGHFTWWIPGETKIITNVNEKAINSSSGSTSLPLQSSSIQEVLSNSASTKLL